MKSLLVTLLIRSDELYDLAENMDVEKVENHILSEIANDHEWIGDHVLSYEAANEL